MKRFALALIFAAGCSYAQTCSDPTGALNNSVGGLTLHGSVTGCLSAGSGSGSNTGTLYVDAPSSYLSSTAPLTVTWTVSEPSAGVYDYSYTIGNVSSTAAVSHVELGIGNGCTTFTQGSSSDCINTLQINSAAPAGNQASFSTLTASQQNGSNPNIPWNYETLQVYPGLSGAVTAPFTFSFVSNEAPVWQNVYVRDGTTGSNEAYNVGACLVSGACPSGATGASDFIATPGMAVPEPLFSGVLLVGLTGLFVPLRVRLKRSSTT
jgi:hypothetical protein